MEAKVLFKLLGDGAREPIQIHPGDAGWDLFTSREAVLPPHSFSDVHTDLAIALPHGVWAMVTGRSSTIRSYGIRVENGIIDNGYRGEMFVGVWNNTNHEIIIEPGTRLAQLILFELVPVYWEEQEDLPVSDRGDRGFGHSGK